MVSVKYALIIAVASFAAGSFFASPLPEAIAAVIATDVQCTGCVGTSDIAGNAVTAAKIKDSEVKAAEIATGAVGASEIAADSVTASEIAGVTKLTFVGCSVTGSNSVPAHQLDIVICGVRGVDADDEVVATKTLGANCFIVSKAFPGLNRVGIWITNACSSAQTPGSMEISIIVFDT